MGKIVRVDMSEGKARLEETPKSYANLAGRGLTSMIVGSEVPARCHALGRRNKLVIAPGALTGTGAPNSGRLSIGCKSPLTEGIKESNVGGTPGHQLGRLGIDAVVLESLPQGDGLHLLHLSKRGAELIPCGEYKGLKNYELVKKLQDRFGSKTSILSIGPVGEMKLSTATVAATDTSGFPCRHAARGGPGAVMGSKGLKAVVIDDEGTARVSAADPEKFKTGARRCTRAFKGNAFTQRLKDYGTSILVKGINSAGAFPTRNFREGYFKEVDRISGEHMKELLAARGGKQSHAGCSTCIIRCSNVYVDEQGSYITSSLEYETIWAHGANLGVADLDSIAWADRLCDDYGMDTMEIGAAIGVAMDAGLKPFGDSQGALELLKEVGEGTPLGRILGSGSWITGKVFGATRVPTVKRQAMAAYDPRGLHGMGVTYATSPMGADHTAGVMVHQNLDGELDPHKPDGQVDTCRQVQIRLAAVDCTGLCLFANRPIFLNPEGLQGMLEMMGARYGVVYTLDDFFALGRKVLRTEREFNLAAGMTRADDRLPEFFKEEKIPPHNVAFTVEDEDLDRLFEF
ncbi:MAG: aldehyde ferredoxin oxidoreductase [Deltaproteobacteria bacterium HGW-Deltaproteobacteria-15]|jgi:aldehyde:ferredoxin oxidoreductase|nr:MAG: aldehyde ferredoxin oxidoreductase [Deltaproteobacteria bacterium HGW-Deltaproteobacteria-15]